MYETELKNLDTNFGKNLTVGSARSILIGMWIPLVMGSLLTMGYSIINSIWVGQIMGSRAMSAVAVTMPIIQLTSALISGVATGASILIARYFGANDDEKMKNVVFNAWAIAVVLIVLVTGGGILFCEQLLWAMGTPADVVSMTSGYMKIIFASFIFSTAFSLISSILRGVGDSKKPMIFVLLSTLINAVLDPLLIMGAGPIPKMGLNGAGLASLLASATACVLGYLHMRKQKALLKGSSMSGIDFQTMWQLLKIGIPTAMQQILFAVGSIFIVVFVNSFGVAATAAYGAITRIESFITLPGIAMSMALSIITGQNLGASKPERIKEFFKSGVVISAVYTLLISFITIVFPHALMSMFVNDPATVAVGVDYFRIVGYAYLFISLMFVANGIINGAGKTFISFILSFVSICIVRIPLAGFMQHTSMGIKGIWIALIISYTISVALFMTYYLRGIQGNRKIIIANSVKLTENGTKEAGW